MLASKATLKFCGGAPILILPQYSTFGMLVPTLLMSGKWAGSGAEVYFNLFEFRTLAGVNLGDSGDRELR